VLIKRHAACHLPVLASCAANSAVQTADHQFIANPYGLDICVLWLDHLIQGL
jgi:hypothetical protein